MNSETQGKQIKVLIIDDTETFLIMHRIFLRNLGCHIEEAKDGAEALNLPIKKFDIIFTDIHMPNLDGIEFSKSVRPINSNIPIIAISGELSELEKQACFNAGINEIIRKPIMSEDFLHLINKWCFNKIKNNNNQ
jgi:CheY-like chemotaxis protein